MSKGTNKTIEEQDAVQEREGKGLDEVSSIPTSRVGRFLRTGWVARHAVPLALKRTVELVSAKKEDRKEIAESLLKEQEAVAEELFRTLGTLKGVAQKFGQLASYFEGILPADVAPIYERILSKLQASAPALPPLASQDVIEEELDCLIEDHFDEFEEHPFAAASIGQVHRATLHDGTRVAVKVQYPGIEKAFQSDLKNIKLIEVLFAPVIHYYKGREAIDVLREQLMAELDYEREARTQQHFYDCFKDHPDIHVPKVFHELSTGKLLVTELVEGYSFAELKEKDLDTRNKMAAIIAQYYWESICLHKTVNTDPHPGNYVFREDGKVAFLDFGAAEKIDPALVLLFCRNLHAHMNDDKETFYETAAETYSVAREDDVVYEAYCEMIRYYLNFLHPGHQPFQFSRKWIESCIEEGMSRSKQILTRGGRVPKLPPRPENVHPDITILQRVGFGLASLFSRLEVSQDWAEILRPILLRTLEEAGEP